MTLRAAKVLGALAAVLVALGWVALSRLRGPACSGAIFFEFHPPLSGPGRYRLRVDLGDKARSCELEFSLPLRGKPDKSRCPMAVQLRTQGYRQATNLVGFAIGASPEKLRLTVQKGQELVYDTELAPSYSPYPVERAQSAAFCGQRAFVEPSCIRGTSECSPFPTVCDGPEDCAKHHACCIDPEWGKTYGSAAASECTFASRCLERPAYVACHHDGDCPQGMKCRPAPFAEEVRGALSVCR